MPLAIDLSISCCRVIFFAAFFFAGFDGSVVAASVLAAGAVVVVVVAAAGGGAAGVVAVWASTMPPGTDTNAIVAKISEIFGIKESRCMKSSNAGPARNAVSVIPWHRTMQAAINGLFAARRPVTAPCPPC